MCFALESHSSPRRVCGVEETVASSATCTCGLQINSEHLWALEICKRFSGQTQNNIPTWSQSGTSLVNFTLWNYFTVFYFIYPNSKITQTPAEKIQICASDPPTGSDTVAQINSNKYIDFILYGELKSPHLLLPGEVWTLKRWKCHLICVQWC